MRWRLVAIVAVPAAAAIILGAVQITNAVSNVVSSQQVQTLAKLNQAVTALAGRVADERDLIAGYIAIPKATRAKQPPPPAQAAMNATNNAVSTAKSDAARVGASYDPGVRSALNKVLSDIADLKNIRTAALSTAVGPRGIEQTYNRLVQDMDDFGGKIGNGTGNVTLENNVAALAAMLRVEDDASRQRGILYSALEMQPPTLAQIGLSDLTQAEQQENADINQFNVAAGVQESQLESNTVSGQRVDEAAAEKAFAAATVSRNEPLSIGTLPGDCAGQTQAACWFANQGARIAEMRTVSDGLGTQVLNEANSLESKAMRNAIIYSALTLVLLLLVLFITMIVARSMTRPLRKLRQDALEVANSRLPEMVRRLSESEGDEGVDVEPIGVTSTDEIGEVARAFDQVHREALRLAADEAMLRGNLNAMFVNLSRRSQSLIERQLALIDTLEQSEQDPDRLSSLFRLDHLATRMRRNSENLLVLAGHESSRRWSQPVPLVDVLRAAISEIEQYERVVLNVQPGIVVVGQAVNDVVHLVAEVVENATTFSPEDTQVYVTGQPLSSGGILLDITDNGVGISEQEMAHANWRLDNPPVVDVAVSRRMGLFVVGRLAARHGVRVRLRHAQSGGLTALIWLPDTVAAPEGAPPLGRLRRFEADDYGPSPSLSAPTPAAGAPAFGQPFAVPGGGNGAPAGGTGASRIPRFTGPGAKPPGGDGGWDGGRESTGPQLPMRPVPANGSNRDQPAGASGPLSGNTGPMPGGGSPGGSLGGGSLGGGSLGGGQVSPPGPPNLAMPPTQAMPAFGGPAGGMPNLDAPPSGDGPQDLDGSPDLDAAPGLGVPPSLGGAPSGSGATGSTGPTSTGSTGTSRMPSFADGPSTAETAAAKAAKAGTGSNGATVGTNGDGVTIPPAANPAHDQRLPIFDSLESDWFRRSGKSLSSTAASSSKPAAQAWTSPADEGWRAARVVASPAASETTSAGLPKRVPRANLVPGSVGAGGGGGGPEEATPASPSRSAEAVRSRMASFQRGVREARAAGPQDEEP